MNITVPRFRVPGRLIAWMHANGIRERVPQAEKVFQRGDKSDPWHAASYAKLVGKLPPELERVVANCPSACVEYAGCVGRDNLPDYVVDKCGEAAGYVVRLANKFHGRVPSHLEAAIKTPEEYVNYAGEVGRVPELEDRILFSGDFPAKTLADAAQALVQRLSGGWGPVDKGPVSDFRIRNLIKGDVEAVERHMNFVGSRGCKLDEDFHECFMGHGPRLLRLAQHLRRRLPEHLEITWNEPISLVEYATSYVRARLPDQLEEVLATDHKSMVKYAFGIIRAYASPRLPDSLHQAVLLKSFEYPGDSDIKRYTEECDRIQAPGRKQTQSV